MYSFLIVVFWRRTSLPLMAEPPKVVGGAARLATAAITCLVEDNNKSRLDQTRYIIIRQSCFCFAGVALNHCLPPSPAVPLPPFPFHVSFLQAVSHSPSFPRCPPPLGSLAFVYTLDVCLHNNRMCFSPRTGGGGTSLRWVVPHWFTLYERRVNLNPLTTKESLRPSLAALDNTKKHCRTSLVVGMGGREGEGDSGREEGWREGTMKGGRGLRRHDGSLVNISTRPDARGDGWMEGGGRDGVRQEWGPIVARVRDGVRRGRPGQVTAPGTPRREPKRLRVVQSGTGSLARWKSCTGESFPPRSLRRGGRDENGSYRQHNTCKKRVEELRGEWRRGTTAAILPIGKAGVRRVAKPRRLPNSPRKHYQRHYTRRSGIPLLQCVPVMTACLPFRLPLTHRLLYT
ncbi:hypothetical protein E2C01_015291 [Portunus trituberculatus]|uniref:Uncharacterized protein n=1 Tax=Portunus trituberculatus TaxID=210409 RepID=A0A5B7DMF7_PORTR|nr:hypothetical protein [Portunus trituberculatus]